MLLTLSKKEGDQRTAQVLLELQDKLLCALWQKNKPSPGFETTPGNYPGSDENTLRGSTPLPNGQNPNGGSPNEPGYPGHPGKPSSQQPNSSNPSGQNPTNDQPDTDGYWTPGKYNPGTSGTSGHWTPGTWTPGQKPQSRIGKPSSGNPTSSNPYGQNPGTNGTPGTYTPGKSSSGSSHDDLLKSVPQIQTNGKPLDGQGIINNLKNCVDPNTNTIGAHNLFPYLNGQIDMPLSNLLSRPSQSFPVDYDGLLSNFKNIGSKLPIIPSKNNGNFLQHFTNMLPGISESSSGNSDLLSSLSVGGLLGGSSSSSGSNGGSGLLSGLGGVLSGGSNDNKKSSGILGGIFG